MTRPAARPGFTLLEILLVMAILVALAAISYPSISAMYGDVRVKAGADQVRGAWTECRAYAIDEGQPYRFAVQPNTGKFRLAPHSDEFWSGGSGPTTSDGTLPPHVSEGELPKDIVFEVPDGFGESTPDGWTAIAVFLPDGSAEADREVTLKADDLPPVVVRVRAMTGAVSVRPGVKAGGQ